MVLGRSLSLQNLETREPSGPFHGTEGCNEKHHRKMNDFKLPLFKMMKLGLTPGIEFVKCRFLPGLCHPWHLPGQTGPEDSRTFCGIFIFIIPLNTSKCSNLGTTDFNCSSHQAEMSQHYLESPQTLFSGQVHHLF